MFSTSKVDNLEIFETHLDGPFDVSLMLISCSYLRNSKVYENVWKIHEFIFY